MKKLYLIKKKKSQVGRPDFVYIALGVELGYQDAYLSFNRDVIASVLGWPVSKLFEIDFDKKVYVGTFEVK